jgi:hypothetical protein
MYPLSRTISVDILVLYKLIIGISGIHELSGLFNSILMFDEYIFYWINVRTLFRVDQSKTVIVSFLYSIEYKCNSFSENVQ